MRLKPRQVEAFRSVMLSGSVTAAAETLNITQPAVSRLIRDLEGAVRMTLFARTGARLIPTSEATKLYREVERLYLGLDQIAQAASDIRLHRNTVLRLASVTSLVRPFLHRAIIETLSERLDVPLVIDVENSRHIWDMVARNRYDLGFALASPRPTDLDAHQLYSSQAVVAMAPGHPFAGRKQIGPDDLINERVLLPGRNSPLRLALDRVFAVGDHLPVSTVETSMMNCCQLAASGLGIGIVDRVSLLASGAKAVSAPFVPALEVSYVVLRPPGSQNTEIIEQIVDRMRDMLRVV